MGISRYNLSNILYDFHEYEAYKIIRMLRNNIQVNFNYNDYEFIYNSNDDSFTVKINNNYYHNAYELYISNVDESLSFNTYCSSYNFNELSDFNELVDYILINASLIYLYDRNSKEFKYHKFNFIDYKSVRKILLMIIENKIPFRVTPRDIHDDITIYIGNINGEYKIYDPYNLINDEDEKNIKLFDLMELI